MSYRNIEELKFQDMKTWDWVSFFCVRLTSLGLLITVLCCLYSLLAFQRMNLILEDKQEVNNLKIIHNLLHSLDELFQDNEQISNSDKVLQSLEIYAQNEMIQAIQSFGQRHKNHTAELISCSLAIKVYVLKIFGKKQINEKELQIETLKDFIFLGQILILEQQFQLAIDLLQSGNILFPDDEQILSLIKQALELKGQQFKANQRE